MEASVPPPIVALVFGLAMWLAARTATSFGFTIRARNAFTLFLALAGVAVVVAGIVEFRRARTTVNPLNPGSASALVGSRVYRFTRNPMYLGFAMILLGWAVHLSSALSVLGVAGFVAYMNRFQIRPEEKALRVLFGQEFDAYSERVRRWI